MSARSLSVMLLGLPVALGACALYGEAPPVIEPSADIETLTRVSQAPYRYRQATYWTLANGCTYSPSPGLGGGWRWFLVANPLRPAPALSPAHCQIVFDADV